MQVVIPAFNAAASIGAAVASAFHIGATGCIVVDDGSTDETATIASRSGATVVRQNNAGASRARMRGLELVDSPEVVFLDADDELLPGISRAVGLLRSDADVAVVGGRALVQGRRSAESLTRSPRACYSTGDLLAIPVSPWPPAASVWRTDHLRQAVNLDIPALHPRFAEDYELLVRGSLVGQVWGVGVPTCRYDPVGGKSMRSARSSVSDAVRIQGHYAQALGISVVPWSESEIDRRAAWRQFRGLARAEGYVSAAKRATLDRRFAALVLQHFGTSLFKRLRGSR